MKIAGKIMKSILIGVAALIALIIIGVILLVIFAGYKNENYWKFASPKGTTRKGYTKANA